MGMPYVRRRQNRIREGGLAWLIGVAGVLLRITRRSLWQAIHPVLLRAVEAKVRYNRKVVRCDQCRATAMKGSSFEFQGPVEIDVIKVQKRHETGIRSPSPQVKPRVHALKVTRQ